MQPADIAWTVCFILWLICFVVRHKLCEDEPLELHFLSLEWIFLGFGWVFIGLSHGWW